MGNYLVTNAIDEEITIRKRDSDQPKTTILGDSLGGLTFDANSKYRIKRKHALVAFFWTNEIGMIRKFKNVGEHVFINVKHFTPEVGLQTSLNKAKGTETSTLPMIIIDRRVEVMRLTPPSISSPV